MVTRILLACLFTLPAFAQFSVPSSAPLTAALLKPAAVASGTAWITSNPATSWRNNFDGCVGSLFTTDGTARTITHLGLYVKSGNTATVTVRILNGVTEITSAEFNQTGMPEGWNYIELSPSVSLPASTSMAIARVTVNLGAGDNWPDDWVPTTSGITSSFSSAYNAGTCTDESNFVSVTPSGMFGGVNFKYTTP
jgi:hypothetical protein